MKCGIKRRVLKLLEDLEYVLTKNVLENFTASAPVATTASQDPEDTRKPDLELDA
jgi:hypothetical protein